MVYLTWTASNPLAFFNPLFFSFLLFTNNANITLTIKAFSIRGSNIHCDTERPHENEDRQLSEEQRWKILGAVLFFSHCDRGLQRNDPPYNLFVIWDDMLRSWTMAM